MIVLGLTGSIGMGKTTTANMFRDAGIPVHSADEAVHRLYAAGGEGAAALGAIAPGALAADGSVDRDRLRDLASRTPDLLQRIEAAIHPLVRADRDAFLARVGREEADVSVLDVPLLFETGGDREVGKVLVVSAPPEIQRERVLARPGMTEDAFQAILARQMPDAEKRERADYVVDTGAGLEPARAQVKEILSELSGRPAGEA